MPTTLNTAASFGDWAAVFFLYGPFFITLFIMIYSVRQAKMAVDKADQARPRDAEAARLFRRIYLGVWIFSAILVVSCCTWWFINYSSESGKKYVWHLDISNAQPTDRLEPNSTGVFARTQNAGDPDLRHDEFVVVKEKSPKANEVIEIVHKKGADAVYTYPIRVADLSQNEEASFKLVFDNGRYQLMPKHPLTVPNGKSTTELLGVSLAYAEIRNPIVGKPVDVKPSTPFVGAQKFSLPSKNSATAQAASPLSLQDFWSDQLIQKRQTIGRQIEALEALEELQIKNQNAIELLRPVATSEIKGETLLSALLNLSRHQDKLLAFKAQRLLDKTNYLSSVIKVATATNDISPEVQRQVLIALNEKQWESVANEVAAQQKVNISRQQKIYSKTATPVPSATYDGTRYFSVISWPILSDSQTKCLAEKVYRHNLDASSLAEEQREIAKGNTIGIVFDTRAEAAVFADSVKTCGAKTDFVYRGDKRLSALK